MRQLVELDERSRCTQPGERDPIHALKILKNHVKGSVVILFFSEATRMYTVGKLMALHESEGQFVTIAAVLPPFSPSSATPSSKSMVGMVSRCMPYSMDCCHPWTTLHVS